MQKKKVLVWETLATVSGGQKMTLAVMDMLSDKFEFCCLIPAEGMMSEELKKRNIPYVLMGDQTLPTGVKGKQVIFRYGWMSVKNVWKSLGVIRKYKPDILYAPGPAALPWSAVCGTLARKPVIWHLHHMLRKDMEVAQKEVSRAKSELDLKDDERNALKDEMIRVIRGKSSIDRDMIQQLLDENQAAIQAAQDALTAAQNKLEEIEQENKKAENDCSNLFTWASTYQNASFQQRQAILNQFIKEVRVGRDYDIEIILNVPLEEFEEFKSHSLSVRTPSGRKTDLKQAPVRGLGTPNGGIVVFDKTSGEAMNIMPKSSAHVTLRCQDE